MYRFKSLDRLVPRRKGEKALVACLVVAVPFCAAWMWWVILPNRDTTNDPGAARLDEMAPEGGTEDLVDQPVLYKENNFFTDSAHVHLFIILYIGYNVILNFATVIRVEANGDASLLPFILKPGKAMVTGPFYHSYSSQVRQ